MVKERDRFSKRLSAEPDPISGHRAALIP